jgi:hypothetical membrane protein
MNARSNVFARVPSAVAVSAVLAAGSMARYPGGTLLDRSSVGYSFSQNFLSDLGMTVAYDGQSNRMGALCFVLSLGILVVALGGCLVGFLRIHTLEPRARRFARAASAVGFIVCAAFAAVAITPENRVMPLHVAVTLLAWRAFPVLAVLYGLAAWHSSVVSMRATLAWAALTLSLTGYSLFLALGPALDTVAGLRMQVIAQKSIAVAAVAFFLYPPPKAIALSCAPHGHDDSTLPANLGIPWARLSRDWPASPLRAVQGRGRLRRQPPRRASA